MKTKTTPGSEAIAGTPSKWMRPALVTLALSAVLVATGCNRSDDSKNQDSDHRDGNHRDGNHRDGNHREGNHRDHPMNGNK